MLKTLSYSDVKQFYDSFGIRQDNQPFEENAIQRVLEMGDFGRSHSICEFGSGTGLAARQLFSLTLPSTTTYVGIDSSETMVAIARERLAMWAGRATIIQSNGSIQLPLPDAGVDRFLSTYVLDLLSEKDIHALVAEARRVLVPGGLLCIASLTHGSERLERLVEAIWMTGFRIRPKWVGGCRPIDLSNYIKPGQGWQHIAEEKISQLGFCSQVLIATKQ